MSAQLTLVLAANKESIPRLSQAVEGFAHRHALDSETVDAAQLALEEIVQNIIVHGHLENKEEAILVRLTLFPHELLLEVEDSARPFNPLEHASPALTAPVEERPDGGLGIFLVRQVMDWVQYRFDAGKNHLIMGKKVSDDGTH